MLFHTCKSPILLHLNDQYRLLANFSITEKGVTYTFVEIFKDSDISCKFYCPTCQRIVPISEIFVFCSVCKKLVPIKCTYKDRESNTFVCAEHVDNRLGHEFYDACPILEKYPLYMER